MIETHVTPAMLTGAVQADGSRIVSPEAQDVLDRLRAHYQGLGKPSAASNYGRHLKSFFAWAENHGHSVRGLPSDAVESFLTDLRGAGQKEATIHVMRTQLKSALREAHNALGVDFAHLEYQTGKPREVRKAQKDREKAKRHEKRMATTIAQAQAIMAAQSSGQPLPRPDLPIPDFFFNNTTAPVIDLRPEYPAITPEEYPMSTASAPMSEGTMVNGAAAPQQQPVVVVQMPPQTQRPTTTIGATKPAGQQTTTVGRGMTINSHTFTGPYIRVSRMADGTDPLTPPGTETYITTVPLTQLLPHGDAAAYLQSFILPNLRLSQSVGQVHFVFHELNDRRQPTGRRDELVVSVPMGMGPGAPAPAQQAQQSFGGLNGLPTGGNDRATDYLLRKLDEDASNAKRRADDLQEKLRTEKDSQNMFLLMQQFQKEQDLRRELENQKQQAMAQMQQMQMMSMAPPTLPMPMIDPTPKSDASAEMVRAMSENQAKMMEAMMVGMRPQPTPPQKDAAEWLIPFISQMNQQAQVQQQANQQMLVGIMQSNQQFMQAMLQKESPIEKMLMSQLQEAKAEARAPKGDDMEDFAEKLQKMKMVSDMLGGGGGGGGSLISELLSNAEAIGEGAAKIIAASKNQVTLPTQPTGPQMNGSPVQQALPAAQQAAPAGPPPAVLEALAKLEIAAEKADDQEVVTEVVNIIRHLIDAGMPAAGMGNRLLTAFKDMDDEMEMFTFAKSMWVVGGKKADKKLAKVVAAILAKWYTDIHEQLFGTRRAIGEEVVEVEAIETDEDGSEEDDSEEDEEAEDGDDE